MKTPSPLAKPRNQLAECIEMLRHARFPGRSAREQVERFDRILAHVEELTARFRTPPPPGDLDAERDYFDADVARRLAARARRDLTRPAQKAAFCDAWALAGPITFLRFRNTPQAKWLKEWRRMSGQHAARAGSVSRGKIEELATQHPRATAAGLWRMLLRVDGRPSIQLSPGARSRPIPDASGVRMVRRILSAVRQRKGGQHLV